MIATDEIRGMLHDGLSAEPEPAFFLTTAYYQRSRSGVCAGPLMNIKALVGKNGAVCVKQDGNPINSHWIKPGYTPRSLMWLSSVVLLSISMMNQKTVIVEQDDTAWSVCHDQQKYTLRIRS
jgi:hypothetical protein